MIVNELFNSDAVTYEVVKASAEHFKTQAIINGRKIVFHADLDHNANGEFWDIAFAEEEGFNQTYGLTGHGKPFDVLSMVKASMIEFRDRYHPEIVYFTADSKTRANVYRKMVGQVLKGFKSQEIELGGDSAMFVYRKL